MAPLLEGHAAEQERVGNPCLQWLREVARAVVEAGLDGQALATAKFVEPAEEDGVAYPNTVPSRGDEPSYARAGRALKKAFNSDADETQCLAVGEYAVTRHSVIYHDEDQRKDKSKWEYTVTKR